MNTEPQPLMTVAAAAYALGGANLFSVRKWMNEGLLMRATVVGLQTVTAASVRKLVDRLDAGLALDEAVAQQRTQEPRYPAPNCKPVAYTQSAAARELGVAPTSPAGYNPVTHWVATGCLEAYPCAGRGGKLVSAESVQRLKQAAAKYGGDARKAYRQWSFARQEAQAD